MRRYDPQKHHRHSVRLRGYDYSTAGAYFVTICVQNKARLFGEIENNGFNPYPSAEMIRAVWNEVPAYYKGVETGEFIVMPNHIHAIIIITQPHLVGTGSCVESHLVGAGPCACPRPLQQGQPQGVAPTLSLPDIVHRFKTMTTKRYADGVKTESWPPFPGRLWQRNYYEHVIRNDEDYDSIAEYIINNPNNWKLDKLWTDIEQPSALGQPSVLGQPRGVAPTKLPNHHVFPNHPVGAGPRACPNAEIMEDGGTGGGRHE